MIKQWVQNNKTDLNLINSLVIPLLFTQIIQIIFQFGDQAIVGRLGLNEFAAVGVAGSFLYLITGTIGILSTAFNIVGGRYFGQNDIRMFGTTFNVTMTLSIIIGLFCEAVILVCGEWTLKSIYGLEPTVLKPAVQYLHIGGLGIGMNMILFNFSAYFKNIRKTKVLIYSFLTASIVNISLDYVLVFGKFGLPELGVRGAAMGSVAGFSAGIAISIVVFRKYRIFNFHFQMNKLISRQLLKLYYPLALQDLVEYTLFAMCITAIIARLNVELLAAYTLLTTLIEIILLPMYGFSGGCMTLTAQSYGKQNHDYPKYAKLSFALLMLYVIPLAFLVITFSLPLTRFITDKESIITIAQQIVPWAVAVNLLNGLQMIIKSALQAVELENWVLIYSAWIYAASLLLIYLLVNYFELIGLYSGFGLCYLMLSTGYMIKFKRKTYRIR